MPFLKEIIPKKNIRILIWKIDEKLSELKASFLLTRRPKKFWIEENQFLIKNNI